MARPWPSPLVVALAVPVAHPPIKVALLNFAVEDLAVAPVADPVDRAEWVVEVPAVLAFKSVVRVAQEEAPMVLVVAFRVTQRRCASSWARS